MKDLSILKKNVNVSFYFLIFFFNLLKYINILNKLKNLTFFFKKFFVFKNIVFLILKLKNNLIALLLKLYIFFNNNNINNNKHLNINYFNDFIFIWNDSYFIKTFYFFKIIRLKFYYFVSKILNIYFFFIKNLSDFFFLKKKLMMYQLKIKYFKVINLYAITLLLKNRLINSYNFITLKSYFILNNFNYNYFFKFFNFSKNYYLLFYTRYLNIFYFLKFFNFFILNLSIYTNTIFNLKTLPHFFKFKTHFKSRFILLNKYYKYILDFNLDKKKFFYTFYQNNYSFNAFIQKLNLLKRNSLKLFKNNIYLKKNYEFISIKFFKLYLNVILLWYFNNNYNLNSFKSKYVYRNIFIMYIKHLNFSFFTKYLYWINKSKKIVITLNVNIKKNNLFYTLINKSGKTLANISKGLFYLLPKNKNLKKNPFKKSINYLTYEMFSVFFYNKFIYPLKNYKLARKLNYLKFDSFNNEKFDYLLIKKKKKFSLLRNKKLRIYFIFKFLKQKYFFPGLSKNFKLLIGNRRKKNKWGRSLYYFVGVYKMYPRVHNGCRKKKKRRL